MTLFSRHAPDRRWTVRIPSPSVLVAGTAAFARMLINRRAAHRIADLPDYLLSDIGLKRDDVHDALARDWREDPTFRLALAAAKRRRRA